MELPREFLEIHSFFKNTEYPYCHTFSDLATKPCKFEISGPVEEFRVLKFGGEEEFTRIMLDNLQSGDIFFIGSCIGIVAIPAALRSAQVVSFEPDPEYRSRLCCNLNLNNLQEKVHVVEWAVADHEGKMLLHTNGIQGESPRLSPKENRDTVLICTNSIDNAIRLGMLPIPDVKKLDIEGAEFLALKGMKNLLGSTNSPRFLCCELHPEFLKSFDSTTEECVALVESFGYKKAYWQARYDQIRVIFKNDRNAIV